MMTPLLLLLLLTGLAELLLAQWVLATSWLNLANTSSYYFIILKDHSLQWL